MLSRRAVSVTPLLFACVCSGCGGDDPSKAPGSEAATGWTDPAADDDWSDLIDPPPEGTAATAADVEAGIARALAHGAPSASVVFARYLDLLDQGDADCPGSAMAGGFEVHGVCTSAAGVTFSGVAGLVTMDERLDTTDGDWTGRYSVMTAPADFVITRADGTQLQAGGVLRYEEQRGPSLQWTSQVAGTWADGDATGWLGEGFSGELHVQGEDRGGGERTLRFNGGYSAGVDTIGFDGVFLSDRDCPDGVFQGKLGLRLGDGQWAGLQFDRCAACAEAVLDDGTALGEVCVDRDLLDLAYTDTLGMP